MAPGTFRRVGGPYRPTAPMIQGLWRIMDSSKLETMLDGGLWFARLDQFGDRLEGSLPVSNQLGLLSMMPIRWANWVVERYESAVRHSYALCWHMNDGDPPASLWSSFGAGEDSVAVRTGCNLLMAALAPVTGPDGHVHFGAIRYIDHQVDDIPEGNVIEAAFVVRNDFAAEREARALIHTDGSAAYDQLYGRDGRFGQLVSAISRDVSASGMQELQGGHDGGAAIVLRFDARQLVQEIVIGPHATSTGRARIQQIATRFSFTDRLRT